MPDFGLALRFPEGWEVHENDASLRLLARPLRDGKPVPGVWFIVARDRAREPRDGLPVSSASAMPSLASYVERRESLAQKDVLDYHVVADTRLTLDGIAAVRRERTYGSYTRKLGACAVMAVRGRYGYELTGAAPASEYSRWQPVFAAIAGSLRWLPQPETADAPAPDR